MTQSFLLHHFAYIPHTLIFCIWSALQKLDVYKALHRQYFFPISFLCLFVWGLSSHSIIVHPYRDFTIVGEELQILTFARHSWSLSSEGSLACHAYCDTRHPFIMVISEDHWHSHLLPSVWLWSWKYLF